MMDKTIEKEIKELTERYEAELEKINQLIDDASDRAIYLIKKEARRILQEDPDLDEFIMAMGDCFFTYKDGSKYDMMRLSDEEYEDIEGSDMDYWGRVADGIIHDRSIHEDFFDMIDYLDERFRVCGYPVRFTANS